MADWNTASGRTETAFASASGHSSAKPSLDYCPPEVPRAFGRIEAIP
jgi:hypothetical protein